MATKQGTIKAPSVLNIQAHEMATARALADAGYDVEFARRIEGYRVTLPDVVIGGVLWEMKAPQAGNRKAIERNLRKYAGLIKAVKRLRFVNRDRDVIDIK